MRVRRVIMAVCLAAGAAIAQAQPQPLGTFWRHDGKRLSLVPCSPALDADTLCRGVAAIIRGRTVRLGEGYLRVRRLWTKPRGGDGPDVLILGDRGGSGGAADLIAVTWGRTLSVRTLTGERYDGVTVRPGAGLLRLTLPFDVEFFNGAPHAGAIVRPIPVRWAGGDVRVELARMTGRSVSLRERRAWTDAARTELAAWAAAQPGRPRLASLEGGGGTPVTATALLDLILAGRADQARALLHDAWPRRDGGALGGEDDVWRALCVETVRQPLWVRFRLSRLPHAAMIERAAVRARRPD